MTEYSKKPEVTFWHKLSNTQFTKFVLLLTNCNIANAFRYERRPNFSVFT